MRNAILFFCLLLSVCACNRRSYPHELLVADSLCYEMPDSAVVMLQRMETEMTDKDEATRMYYYLLTIKAKDKAYIFHTSDSLILSVLQYYQKKKDTRHLPEAYYYAGRVYRDLGDAPQALDYFQKAIDAMGEKKDYVLLNTIYSQMGYLFLFQDVYEEAMNSFRQSYQCDLILNDSLGMAHSLKDVGNAFTAFHNGDSALHYYDKSYEIAKSINNGNMIDGILCDKISIYLQLENYEFIPDMFNRLDSLSSDRSSSYRLRADYYNQMNQLDSAKLYYGLLINDENIYARKDAYWGLAKIAQRSNDSNTALRYISEYEKLTYDIIDLQNTEQIRKIRSLYNYQLREKEINKLNIENHRKEKILIQILGICCLICFLFGIYYLHNRKKKALLRLQLEQLEKEQHAKSIQFISENNKKIALLEQQLQEADETNILLRKRLEGQRDIIISTNQLAELEIKRREEADSLIVYTPIYQLIERILNQQGNQKLFTDDNWKELEEAINEIYPGFTQSLCRLYHMNEHEYRVSLLIKINIQPSHIAILTNHSNESITATRRRLYFKVHGKKGRPHDWDKFIRSL